MDLRERFSKRTLLTVMMLASVAMAVSGRTLAARLRGATYFLLAPLGDGGMYVETQLRARGSGLGARGLSAEEARDLTDDHSRETDQLRRAANFWRGQAEKYRRLAHQARIFQKMYNPDANRKCEFIAARVVAANSVPYGQARMINLPRGSRAKPGAIVTTRQVVHDCAKAIPANLAVINATSLVGRLTEETYAFTARLQLVTDRRFGIRARIRRQIDPNRPRVIQSLSGDAAETPLTEANNKPIDAFARGDGVAGVYLDNIPALDNVRPGDWVLTYPDEAQTQIEVFIGLVEKVDRDPKNPRYVTVHVAPATDLADLRDVFVLLPIFLEGGADR